MRKARRGSHQDAGTAGTQSNPDRVCLAIPRAPSALTNYLCPIIKMPDAPLDPTRSNRAQNASHPEDESCRAAMCSALSIEISRLPDLNCPESTRGSSPDRPEMQILRARQTQPLGATKWMHLPLERGQRIPKQRRAGQRHTGCKVYGQIVVTGVEAIEFLPKKVL